MDLKVAGLLGGETAKEANEILPPTMILSKEEKKYVESFQTLLNVVWAYSFMIVKV